MTDSFLRMPALVALALLETKQWRLAAEHLCRSECRGAWVGGPGEGEEAVCCREEGSHAFHRTSKELSSVRESAEGEIYLEVGD